MLAHSRLHALVLVLVCAAAAACKGGGGSPNSPSNSSTTTGSSTASCRTLAASQRSVQTFTDGVTVTTDTACSLSGTDATCNSTFTDSRFGSGTMTQTSRFTSRSDIVDEAAANPPLARSLGTTTVTTVSGVPFTTTATNSYDAQRRLTSTVVVTQSPPLSVTTSFSAWDASGRPTAGSTTIPNVGQFPVTITYDNANRSVTRDTGLNVCTQTYDTNANIIREQCNDRGGSTAPSTTTVNIVTTQQICK
jgi:hypothetical protein